MFLEFLQWMHAMKKDPTFQKVMETRQDLKDTEGYDWLESTELAIDNTGRKNGFTNVCERCKYVVNLELQICITFALSAKVWANTYIC